MLLLLAWLAATQVAEIRRLGNGLSYTADPFSEADAIRSSEHYVRFGFTSDAGLPNIQYGDRFPTDGAIAGDALFHGVYTRYPPLPNLLCGLFEVTFGFDHVWVWRFVPVVLTLAATVLLFRAFEAAFGSLSAAAVTVLASAAPMTLSYMHGLHFQGYAHALMLLELALLTSVVFGRAAVTASRLSVLALVGFVQGWLSFEYIFIVTGAAIPLALVARQHGHRAPPRLALQLVAAAGSGFLAAIALHFMQVIVFHGSVAAAYADFHGRAVFRMLGDGTTPYLNEVLVVLGRQAKALWIGPNMVHFGILLPAFTVGLVVSAWHGGGTSRREKVGTTEQVSWWRSADVIALLVAYGISGMWVVLMPEHADNHQHFVPRIFFLAYFTAVLASVLRARAWMGSFGHDAPL